MLKLDLDEIQNIILSGYGHLNFSSYLFIQFSQPPMAKKWLEQVIPMVSMATPWPKNPDGTTQKPSTCLNLAFTNDGLKALNVQTDGFLTEFCEGMAGPQDSKDLTKLPNRSRRLGDTNESQPANWELGGPNNEIIHGFLMLFAIDPTTLISMQEQHKALLEQYQIKIVSSQESYRPSHGREPFGFMDGFSQPAVQGSTEGDTTADRQPIIKAGEFLLGYRNEYDLLPPSPTQPELSKNGSYLVYRKLEQDVIGFWNFVYSLSNSDETSAEVLAAKMVGRWRSGAPLTLARNADDLELAKDQDKSNDFTFSETDMKGYGCPVGSHIRRVNPRDSLQPDPNASKVAVARHRILRRGRVFGAEYPKDVVQYLKEVAAKQNSSHFIDDGKGFRGLAQIFINADIKRQFEFIQQSWVNDPKFDGSYDTRDPLIGNNGEESGKNYVMTIPRHPVRQQIQNIPRFVKVLGGGYFYLPSLRGLKFIASQ